MDSHVIYNPEHKVLICRQHKTAIPPHFVERHLRGDHSQLALETRKEITEYAAGLNLIEPGQATVFQEKRAPIHGLVIVDGFRCSVPDCGMLAGSKSAMRKHFKEHTRNAYGTEPERFVKTKLQTFFSGQQNIRYYAQLWNMH